MPTPDSGAHVGFPNLSVCCWKHLNEVSCPCVGVSLWAVPDILPVSSLTELTHLHLRGARDPAVELETEVATTVFSLETEHKVKLSLFEMELQEEINLLKIENQNLHEKLQQEIRLKEDLEKVSCEFWWRGAAATPIVTLWE